MSFSTSKPWASPFPSVKWVYNPCLLGRHGDGMELGGWKTLSGSSAAGQMGAGVF